MQGATEAWLKQREPGSVFWFRVIIRIALVLGRRVAGALLVPVCLYFLCFSIASRRASTDYLTRVLGRRPRLRETLRHYRTFAATTLDRACLLCGRLQEFEIRNHGEEIVEGFYRRREGCVLIGAHFGSFEILRALGLQRPGLQAYFAMFDANAQKISEAFGALNPALAQTVIPLNTPDAMLKINDALERGAFVGLLGDRLLNGRDAVVCDFLGSPAAFPAGPWRLASVLGRPAVLALGVNVGDGRYDIHFEVLLDVWPAERAARRAAIEEGVRRFAARLEAVCRRYPYNWFNFYDFWSTPLGVSSQ